MPKETERTSSGTYHRNQMQRELIIKELKERGCRITKQRQILLDIILENEYTCCKEIYYKAVQEDGKIGTATVYRMLKTLEDIGAISRNNMYRLNCKEERSGENSCVVELDDDTAIHLSPAQWKQVVRCGLSVCGYVKNQGIREVILEPLEEAEG